MHRVETQTLAILSLLPLGVVVMDGTQGSFESAMEERRLLEMEPRRSWRALETEPRRSWRLGTTSSVVDERLGTGNLA